MLSVIQCKSLISQSSKDSSKKKKRIATASDDCTVRLWDWRTGVALFVLEGHTRPVTCITKLSPKRIASGSSDHKIFLWNIQTGKMIRELNFHSSSVQCIIKLGDNRLCSGGHDRYLFVWDQDGNEVGRIERQENENLHCILSITNRIITGSSSSLLLVYNPETWSFVTILAYHRESVTCLEKITQTHFASGSLDGAIVIWHADTLKPSKILAFPEKYKTELDHVYKFHVRSLHALNQRYLVCAVGNGFALYDLYTGERVLDKPDAHDAVCVKVLPLYKGKKIVTCSDDSTIKLWGAPPDLDVSSISGNATQGSNANNANSNVNSPHANSNNNTSSTSSPGSSSSTPVQMQSVSKESGTTFRNLFSKKKTRTNAPILLGEMVVHTAAVNDILVINQSTFVSVGSEGLVVVWRDSKVQKKLRNNLANANLLLYTTAAVNSSSISPRATQRFSIPIASRNVTGQTSESSTPLDETNTPVSRNRTYSVGSVSPSMGDDVHIVPNYIWSFAANLREEKKLSVSQILDHLEEQGHSKQIIEAIEKKLSTY